MFASVTTNSHRIVERWLWVAFGAALLLRLAYLVQASPFDHLSSDAARHWQNGVLFMRPTLMGSIDPLGYQFWLRVLQFLDDRRPGVVFIGTALLSLALPVFWLLALQQIVPRSWALAGAILIALTPSLLLIYSYFMNETLLLVLVACGFWLALRATRSPDIPTLAAVAVVWTAAVYTRMIAIPLAALCLVAVCARLTWPRRAMVVAVFGAGAGLLAIPACWHSAFNLNYCAPYGSSYVNEIYRTSGARTIEIDTRSKGRYRFTSPAMHSVPLAPLSDWHSPRSGTLTLSIDTSRGRADWESMLPVARDYDPGASWEQSALENALLLFFDASWPDNDSDMLLGRVNNASRWVWLPLVTLVMWLLLRTRPGIREGLVPFAGVALVGVLLVQTSGVMEGRYRKPAEPLLIAGVVMLLHRRRSLRTLSVAPSG